MTAPSPDSVPGVAPPGGPPNPEADALRAQVVELAARFADAAHAARPFVPGETHIPVSGKVFGAPEVAALVDASLDFWLTTGRYNDAFEAALAKFLGVRHVLTTNSGSSANLLAIAALNAPALGERALKPGDEVITLAAGFPTTVNPLLLYGQVPVFVDVDIPTYNALPQAVAGAVTDRTRAVVLAHTLGNPFDLEAISALCRERGLWLVEDCCDALGASFNGRGVGTFGDVASLSFYPAHHITTGEGGAVFTANGKLRRQIESIRDWGRDCYCPPGQDNTCGKRFGWQLGGLPFGYDHKYTYANLGYNLKLTDMQAAVGLSQMARLPGFVATRRASFRHLTERLAPLGHRLVLPEATPGAEPSWFGFPITLREGADRGAVLAHLEKHRIGTRLLFGGNLTRQPYLEGRAYRVAGELRNTDRVMRDTFWVGVFPGLTTPMLDYVAETLASALGERL